MLSYHNKPTRWHRSSKWGSLKRTIRNFLVPYLAELCSALNWKKNYSQILVDIQDFGYK